jgi:hypothetical protein
MTISRSAAGAKPAATLERSRGSAHQHPPTTGRMRRLEPWLWFAVVHALLALVAPLAGTGDVTLVYQRWFAEWAHGGSLVGIQTDWVYPVLALLPVLAAGALPHAYLVGWLVLVTALDAVAFHWVGRRDPAAARWWLFLLVALGPVSIGRLDSIAAPLVLLGGLVLVRRPRLAAVLLTVASWVKVWPAVAVLAATVTGPRRRWVALTAVATSALIVAADTALGGVAHVLSFLTQQTGRGLEFEAPVTTIWLWLGAFGLAHVRTAFDPRLLDVEVLGDGTRAAAAATTALMGALVLVVLVLALVVARRRRASVVRLFPPLLLALTLVLIVTNKVGSPQYVTWLGPPVVLGLIADRPRFARLAACVLVLAVLTQAASYTAFLGLGVVTLVMLTVRNMGYAALLVWAVALLVRRPTPVGCPIRTRDRTPSAR